MGKKLSFLLLTVFIASNSFAATNFMPKRFNTVTSHDDVYPYVLNNTKVSKQKTTPTTANTTSAAPIGKRGIIKRTTNARAATTTNNASTNRRVVPRGNTNTTTARAATNNSNNRGSNIRNAQNIVPRSVKPVRARNTNSARITTSYTTTEKVSSNRCFSDYKTCMEMYCQREDTAYNRCYCSAKLAQIDAKYQNKIDELIQEIVKLQYSTTNSGEEYESLSSVKTYWDEAIGSYTGTNPWVNIENALNIEWPDAQSRIRGQNAFNTGHEYCVKNLRGCYYMATNMRDAYKSEIARDCEAYEQSLKKIQMAAESVIKNYKN